MECIERGGSPHEFFDDSSLRHASILPRQNGLRVEGLKYQIFRYANGAVHRIFYDLKFNVYVSNELEAQVVAQAYVDSGKIPMRIVFDEHGVARYSDTEN
jgi:hypothetical protein